VSDAADDKATDNRRAMIADHLALADYHLAEGEKRISHQEALIAEQAHKGRDTAEAEEVLRTMRQTLALMREHREIILDEREQASQVPPIPHGP
jgi:hypothetical protein